MSYETQNPNLYYHAYEKIKSVHSESLESLKLDCPFFYAPVHHRIMDARISIISKTN